MRISIWTIGKNHEPYIQTGVRDFSDRISRYFPLTWNIIPPPKNAASLSEADLRKKEGEIILQALRADDFLVVLDEHGRSFTSEELAQFVQARATASTKHLVLLIGGAYGIDGTVMAKAREKWSLSKLTFPHQLVRLILAEQLYRACTILRNEKYHHR